MTDPKRVSAGAIRDYLRYKKSGTSTIFSTAAEYGQLLLAKNDLRNKSPAGDGHPVMVIPAFTANDTLTRPLRQIIRAKGYKTYAWKGRFNLGMTEKKANHLQAHLKKIFEENGGEKVTIIGHSLGGFYARELAREYPDMVRAVITINTPFGVGIFKDATPPFVMAMIDGLSHKKYSLSREGIAERMLTPPPVPTTSIFSKIDVVAGWQACLNPASPICENVESETSHIASVWNKKTVEIILDRLAQPEGQWQPYKTPTTAKSPPNPQWKPTTTDWHFFPKPSR